jgi:hypothetical protein
MWEREKDGKRARDLNESLGCVIDLADAEHLAVVAMELADVARHIDIHNISLLHTHTHTHTHNT